MNKLLAIPRITRLIQGLPYGKVLGVLVTGSILHKAGFTKNSDIDLIVVTEKNPSKVGFNNGKPTVAFSIPLISPKTRWYKDSFVSFLLVFSHSNRKYEVEVIGVETLKRLCKQNLVSGNKTTVINRVYTYPHRTTPTSQKTFSSQPIKAWRRRITAGSSYILKTPLHGYYNGSYFPGILIDKLLASQLLVDKDREIKGCVDYLWTKVLKRLEYEQTLNPNTNLSILNALYKSKLFTKRQVDSINARQQRFFQTPTAKS